MTDREKLIALLCEAMLIYDRIKDDRQDNPFHVFADHLLANGVTITPAVPGPSEDDPNIMELCFHNGERHMKEKVGKELTRLAEHMPCITLAQALAMLEGL
jgi:hypothetical protein